MSGVSLASPSQFRARSVLSARSGEGAEKIPPALEARSAVVGICGCFSPESSRHGRAQEPSRRIVNVQLQEGVVAF